MKLQPLKNFKYKYLFGDKNLKGDCALVAIFMLKFFFLFLLLWNNNVRLWTQFWQEKTWHFNQENKEGL
jgi:hypothetical protein